MSVVPGYRRLHERGELARRARAARDRLADCALCPRQSETDRLVAGDISPDTYVNLMAQYHPCGDASRIAGLDRTITAGEFDEAGIACRAEGIWRMDGDAGARFRRLRP